MGPTTCTEPQCLYSRAIPLLPLWAVRPVQSLSACTVELYLYSPYGPYGLYRASVLVQCSYTSTPPMGPTTCTEPQCLYSRAIPLLPSVPVQYSYTSTPPMGPTNCTEPQCLYSRAIPLLPSVPVQYSYTSTPPMGRTACTESQCLYSTVIPLLPSVPVQYSYTSTPLSACTVELYLYSPYGSYGLYRASVPVQYSYTSTPLSACTVELYLYSPYGSYGLYRASVPVQRCTVPFTLLLLILFVWRYILFFCASMFIVVNGAIIYCRNWMVALVDENLSHCSLPGYHAMNYSVFSFFVLGIFR